MSADQFAAAYRLHFYDGGGPEVQVLKIGTFDECKAIADMIPAVAYPGDRPLREAEIGVWGPLPSGAAA